MPSASIKTVGTMKFVRIFLLILAPLIIFQMIMIESPISNIFNDYHNTGGPSAWVAICMYSAFMVVMLSIRLGRKEPFHRAELLGWFVVWIFGMTLSILLTFLGTITFKELGYNRTFVHVLSFLGEWFAVTKFARMLKVKVI